MAALIDDEILHAFAIVGEPDQVVDEMLNRFGDVINRTAFALPTLSEPDQAALLTKLRA